MPPSRKRGQRGQILLLACFAAPVTFALLGVVVDVGWMYWRREACLTAAQAAALGGVAKVAQLGSFTCTTTGVWCSTTATQCPKSIPSNNFGTACRFASANFFSTANTNQNVTVTANVGSAPTVSGVTPAYYMTVRVTEKHPLTFLSVLTRASSGWVSARATAGFFGGSSGGCVYVLQTSGTDIQSSGGSINSNCGVYDDSNGSASILMSGGAITTTGGAKTTIATGGACLGGGCTGISPAYVNGPAQSDPLSGMAAPVAASLGPAWTTCQDTTPIVMSSGSKTMTPGLYCHGITISGGSVTMNTGIYIFQGGITMSAGSITSQTGGVMIYEQTGGFAISGGTITLNAMTTGTYAGVLIFQDRSNSSGITMSGSTQTYSGAVYTPDASLTMSGGTFNQTTFVCKTIVMSGGGTETINGAATTQWTPGASSSLIE